MSSTNGTSNPFATDATGAHASLYKAIGVSLAVASGKITNVVSNDIISNYFCNRCIYWK
jgi:hypothetical protein